VIASEDARIGTPYARMWGCYLSGMWLYRLGLTRAKEYALTGKPLSGKTAAEIGLINKAVPFARLQEEVRRTALQLASIPLSQLSAMKLIVNHAWEQMGLSSTQTLGPILDGLMRNTPDALRFIGLASRGPRQAQLDGFDLHANVWVPPNDRARLEQLGRYLLRPPLAQHRVQLRADGRVLVTLKTVWRDGTSHLLFEPIEFLEKLAAIIPAPRSTSSCITAFSPRTGQ
jgi:hypothetical protein